MNSNLSDLMLNLSFNENQKIGSTTSVNEQVDSMDKTLYQMKRFFENQQKEQSEIHFQLKKLEESTKTNFSEMEKQLSDRIQYLTLLFKSDTEKQNGQFEYLEQQNKQLHQEHDKLNEIGRNSQARTQSVENFVGI